MIEFLYLLFDVLEAIESEERQWTICNAPMASSKDRSYQDSSRHYSVRSMQPLRQTTAPRWQNFARV